MKTYLILGLIVVAVAAVAFGGRLFDEGIAVEAAQARTSSIRETIDERGKTRLPRVYRITMPYTARIEEIKLVEGTPVKREFLRIARADGLRAAIAWRDARARSEP